MLQIKVNEDKVEVLCNGSSSTIMSEMLVAISACYNRLHDKDKEIFLGTLSAFADEIFPIADDYADRADCDKCCEHEQESTDELIEKAGELIGALESVLEELNKK